MSNAPNGEHLKAFVERIEAVEAEIKERNDDKKEIYAEVRSHGYDAKIVKQVVAIRREDRDKRAEREEILSLYLSAIGEE